MKRRKANNEILLGILISTIFIFPTNADELVHGFKNPSFSGIGTSAHYLTVETVGG